MMDVQVVLKPTSATSVAIEVFNLIFPLVVFGRISYILHCSILDCIQGTALDKH